MYETKEKLIQYIVEFTWYILAVLLNMSILFVFWRDPLQRLRNPPSYTIANLALANIVGAVGGLGLAITLFIRPTDLELYAIWMVIINTGLQSSFFLFASLAIDRYFAINHPYRYRNIFCQKRLGAILNVMAWITGGTIALLNNFLQQHDIIYHIYAVNIVVMTLITMILYPVSYLGFKKAQRRQICSNESREKSVEDLRLAQQLNQTWMINAVYAVFVLSPRVYMLAGAIGCTSCITDPKFIEFLSYYRTVVFPTLFLANPLIYAWRLPLYRKALKILIKSALGHLRFPCSKNPKKMSAVSNQGLSLSDKDRHRTSCDDAIDV